MELVSIALKECNAQLIHDPEPELVVSINSESSYKSIDDSNFLIIQKYSLSADKNEKAYLTIECVYNLKYTSKDKITDDFFNVFKNISIPNTLWPYFRELVNDITSKMHLPPLILPLVKTVTP